jgi:hypothetical protein
LETINIFQHLSTYRRHDAHVSYVKSRVDEQHVPGDDEAGEGGRDEVDVGEAEVERDHKDLVGQRVEERAEAGGLTLKVSCNVAVEQVRDPGVGKDAHCPLIVPGIDEMHEVGGEHDTAEAQQVGHSHNLLTADVAVDVGFLSLGRRGRESGTG